MNYHYQVILSLKTKLRIDQVKEGKEKNMNERVTWI